MGAGYCPLNAFGVQPNAMLAIVYSSIDSPVSVVGIAVAAAFARRGKVEAFSAGGSRLYLENKTASGGLSAEGTGQLSAGKGARVQFFYGFTFLHPCFGGTAFSPVTK